MYIDDNMSPEIWGKYGWYFWHLVTQAYPEYPTEEDKKNYYQYFQSLKNVLPCKKCQKNLAVHLEKYPLTDEVLSSRENLVKWGIDVHNVVNYYIGKPMLSYDQALAQMDKISNPKKSKTNKTFWCLLLLVIIIILVYLIYRFIARKKLSK